LERAPAQFDLAGIVVASIGLTRSIAKNVFTAGDLALHSQRSPSEQDERQRCLLIR
jgi:hypothetical protein